MTQERCHCNPVFTGCGRIELERSSGLKESEIIGCESRPLCICQGDGVVLVNGDDRIVFDLRSGHSYSPVRSGLSRGRNEWFNLELASRRESN